MMTYNNSPFVDDKVHDDDKHKADDKAHDQEHHDAHDSHDGHAHEADPADWSIAKSMGHYLDPDHLIGHVQDSNYFELPAIGTWDYQKKGKIVIPRMSFWTDEEPLICLLYTSDAADE